MRVKTTMQQFFEALAYFDIETIPHGDEITAKRATNKRLRKEDLWTADAGLFTVEDGEIVVYLVRKENNPILMTAKGEFNFLYHHASNNWVEKRENIEPLINADSTLRGTYSELELIIEHRDTTHFDIDTADYNKTLNPKQREFAERAYGQGEDFEKSMSILNKAGITETGVYFFSTPDLKKAFRNFDFDVIVSVCAIGSFEHSSKFVIDYSYACNWFDDTLLYGKPNKFTRAFRTLLNDPGKTIKHMPQQHEKGLRKLFELQKESFIEAGRPAYEPPTYPS